MVQEVDFQFIQAFFLIIKVGGNDFQAFYMSELKTEV